MLLFLIIVVGLLFRIYHLDSNPPALNWDYASFGYNAYSLLKTGADEYGIAFPLVLRGYDVYSLPLGVYMMIPWVALLGLSEVAVRGPAVLFGVLLILSTYFLVKGLTRNRMLALISALFLSLSPWHIQYSREASFSMLYILLVTASVILFLASMKRPFLLPLSALLCALSFYTYHSALVAGTALLTACVAIYARAIPRTKWVLIAIIAFVAFTIPLLLTIRAGTASNRFHSVSIFQPEITLTDSIPRLHQDLIQRDVVGSFLHNRRLIYMQAFLKNYLEHFRFDYLFFDGMQSRMFRIPDVGLLYLWDLPFVFVGVAHLLKTLKLPASKLLLAWLLIAPLPSALAAGAPSALRAVLFIPAIQIVTALGFLDIASLLRRSTVGRALLVTTVLFLTASVYSFLHMLFIHAPIETAESWNYSVKQAVQLLPRYEQQFEHIIFTYRYKQPYMYYLFYNNVDPRWFQQNWYPGEVMRRSRTVGKITYRDINWEQDRLVPNALIVGTPEEIPPEAPIIERIYSLDGRPTLLFAISAVETPTKARALSK